MRLHSKLVALSLLGVITGVSLAASGLNDRTRSVILHVDLKANDNAPTLDGVLSKNEWTKASVVSTFTQKEPQEGAPATEPTFVLITYDQENIYFGIRCFDKEPEKIVSNEMRRDSDLTDNDYVEIIIDSFNDGRNAYYFATNPLGARVDSEIKSEGTHINWDWDGIWSCEAKRDRHGWTTEIAIPFQTLRFESEERVTWGINFGRYIARKREEAYWAPITRDDDFDSYGKFKVSRFGTLHGLRNIKSSNQFHIKPYVIGGWENSFGLPNSTKRRTDIGLDAKINLTSNITSDITVNTDFAQVEADLEQVNLSRFNLFFPEKRDFFLEGLDIFNIGEESASSLSLLFHSRRIGLHRDDDTFELEPVPLLGGVKLTGKEAGFEIGFLNVFTDDHKYINLNNSEVNIPRIDYSGIRLKQDVSERSYIGIMVLSKDPINTEEFNRTFAADGTFSIGENASLSGYIAKTHTPGLSGNDYNGYASFSWGTDKFSTGGSFTDIGKDFNPEMGFIQWNDIRKYTGQVTLSPRPKFFNLRQIHFTNDFEIITNRNNELQYRTIGTSLTHTFRNDSFFFVGLTNYYDNVPAPGFYLESAFVPQGVYRYNFVNTGFGSDYSRKVAGYVQVGAGSFYDGSFQGLIVSSTVRPGDKFGLDLDWSWNRIDIPFEGGQFTTSILGVRTFYSFTPDLFTKAYIQWNHFDKRVVGNFLMNLIHTPGSDFYLVYNQQWSTDGGFDSTDRMLIAKLTYLFNL